MSRDRAIPGWLVPAGLVALIVALVVVALVREPVELDPSTPEGTVQRYLQAIGDEDYEQVLEFLDPEVFEGCVAADIARFAPHEPFTATLEEGTAIDRDGDEELAVVNVRMRFGTGGPLGSSWETLETFTLVSDDGAWSITEDPWPYFHWECVERGDL